jgi:uncharacterized protein (DUF4415 family)
MSSIPDPELVDDENPEWTEEDLQRAKPARDMLPQIVGKKTADEMLRVGLTPPEKESVTIQLDADVIRHFKANGEGWQNRLNEALRQWIGEHARERDGR